MFVVFETLSAINPKLLSVTCSLFLKHFWNMRFLVNRMYTLFKNNEQVTDAFICPQRHAITSTNMIFKQFHVLVNFEMRTLSVCSFRYSSRYRELRCCSLLISRICFSIVFLWGKKSLMKMFSLVISKSGDPCVLC